MKKRIMSLFLSALMLLSLLPGLGLMQTTAANEPKTADNLVHIKNNHELSEHLGDLKNEHLILDKDISTTGGVGYYIYGEKTIDLNGYDICFDWKRESSYYETRPDTGKEPALRVMSDSSLTVYDSSKKHSGAIRSYSNIYALNDTEFYNGFYSGVMTYNCSILRNTIQVSNGGTLTLMSGSIIAGRSKQQWMTSARDALKFSKPSPDPTDSHTGYGRQIICGTAVTVDNGGTFNCCGGTVEGRGFKEIGLTLEHGHESGGVSFDKIREAWLKDACAAVHAKRNGIVRIYDGNLIGNSGAMPLCAEDGADVDVYSGYFKAEDQPYVILGHTQLPIVNALGYNRHIYVPVKANATGLQKEMFPYGDEGTLIYKGAERKDKNRNVLYKENRGKGKESSDGSVSAGVTLVKGSSKVNVNKANYDLFDGTAASYTVCPRDAQSITLAQITNAVSVTQSKVEYAQNTSCTLNMAVEAMYFPDNDCYFYDKNFTHELREIEWQIRSKDSDGQWKVSKWDKLSDIVENDGTTLDLNKALKNCKVGDVYQISARCTEEWVGKHKYTIQTVAITPEITVVETDKLCQHDYQLLFDTANCCVDGVATYACSKCNQKIEKPSQKKEEHIMSERIVGDATCWEVCLNCGKIFNEKPHDMAVQSTDVLGEHLIGSYLKCRYCGRQTYETQEVACVHECSPNDLRWDENGHWSFCKKCGAKLYDTHHLLPEHDGVRLCEGSIIGGATVGCLHKIYVDTNTPGSFHHEYVNGQYILLPVSFCAHTPLTIDYSHVNKTTLERPKTVVWRIESVSANGNFHKFEVNGGDTLHPADYLSKIGSDSLSEITAIVTFGGDIFSSYAQFGGDTFSSYAQPALYAPMEAVEPTCGQNGRQAHWICANCGQTVSTDKNETSKVIDPTVPATGKHVYDNACDEDCNLCGAIREVPHEWETEKDQNDNTVVKYRQYNEDYHAQYCKRCQKVNHIEGHQWVEEVIRSNCTEVGKTVFTCAVCGYSYEGNITAPAGHSYQLVDYQNENCDEDGSATYKCSVCGDEYTDTIPNLGHISLLIKKIPSTSTEHGIDEHYGCAACDTCFADETGTSTVSPEELELPLDPENVVMKKDPEYSYNETHHWYADDGGTVQYVGTHTCDEDGNCSECGYIPGRDLVLSEEEKEAGAVIRLFETPEIGSAMPTVREYDSLPFRMLLISCWWIGLIILLAVALLAATVVLLIKLKRTKKDAAETNPQPEFPPDPPEENS